MNQLGLFDPPTRPMRPMCHALECPNFARPGLPMCDEHLAKFSPAVREKLVARGRA